MTSLSKLVAKIKRRFIEAPKGALWMPPPYDCKQVVYYRDPAKAPRYFHEPFICNGKCERGWHYGYYNGD